MPHRQKPISALAKVKKSRVDDCLKGRYLSKGEERALREAIDPREERRRAERDTANGWEQGCRVGSVGCCYKTVRAGIIMGSQAHQYHLFLIGNNFVAKHDCLQ
jgi:hypothetical protein